MKKFFKYSTAFILFVVFAIYLAGVFYFKSYFLPNTKINERDMSFTQIAELYENYNSLHDDFELKIVGRDVKESLKLSDFEYRDTLERGQTVKQNPTLWIFSLFAKKEYNLDHKITYDNQKFLDTINKLDFFKGETVEPENAKIVFNGRRFIIEKEVLGNKINKKLFEEKVLDYINEGRKTLNLEDEEIYYSPIVFSDDTYLNNKVSQMNKLNSFEITYDFEDRKEVIKNEELLSLYRENDEGLLVPDRDRVKEYVRTLAGKYDTYMGTRDFYATGLGPIKVEGGIYGWWTDIEKTTDQLVKALENTESVTLIPIYRLTANSRTLNDLGNSYIEVDLGRQHLWLYKEGELVLETDFVSGNPNRENGTPLGTEKIWSKETKRYLTGEDYKSFVDYWLPINWKGVGLHDASWRNEFGGDLYLTNGSHGCINIESSAMKNIYDNAFVGMGVVVYDSSLPQESEVVEMGVVESP
ncbi:L,D-transpeptidase family protein [Anaerosphaera multitolerans]|uniref:L,D-TPase catalytic domain-containing protein n=1 Tax=Anaerosphaera multitolerans TaxID=2487351 RepID=A0A437S5K3_9FIRM|nr:L,D-transpeptidase family protein [Anaerosphaera multitolerans]RVU54322.1 hypothetical protein EF514_07705 [Anaerosphaera multitolerans]